MEPYFNVSRDFKGEWVWELRAPSDLILATSGSAFKQLAKCTANIMVVKGHMRAAERVNIIRETGSSPRKAS